MTSKYNNLTKFDTLDQDQVEGIDFIVKYRYVILADKMGVGKTAQALIASAYANTKRPYPTLCIVPSYLSFNWQMEIEKTLKGYEGIVLKSSKKVKELTQPKPDKIYITSYDMVRRNPTLLGKFKFLIFDEIHYLKSLDSKITEVVHEYVERYKPTLCVQLSGTPVENNIMEFYSPLCLTSYNPKGNNGIDVLDKFTPNKFQSSFQFKRKVKKSGFTSIEWFGFKNKPLMDKLKEKKYLRREGKLGLKIPIYKDILVEFSKDKKLWDDFNSGVSGVDSTTKKEASLFKAKFTSDFVRDLLDQGKGPIVVFSDHPDALKIIAEKVKNYAIIDGSVDPKVRASIVSRFQAGFIDVLLCSIKASSDGWTMTRSNVMVFNDYSWIPTKNKQAEARIDRKGQKEQCEYYYIFGGKCDKRIKYVNEQKSKAITKFHSDGEELL